MMCEIRDDQNNQNVFLTSSASANVGVLFRVLTSYGSLGSLVLFTVTLQKEQSAENVVPSDKL